MISGMLNGYLGYKLTLEIVAILFMIMIFCVLLFVSNFELTAISLNHCTTNKSKFMINIKDIVYFFSLPNVKPTLITLTITICTTSTFNVCFINLLLVKLHYTKTIYGIIVSAISVGLVFGPLVIANKIKKIGVSKVPCLCASIIGVCLSLAGSYQGYIWLYCVLLLLGIANGLQNTFMSTFIMMVVPSDKRKFLMPIYLMVIQISVLIGFILAGFIPTDYADWLLIIAGVIAFLAGLVGYLKNDYNIKLRGEFI